MTIYLSDRPRVVELLKVDDSGDGLVVAIPTGISHRTLLIRRSGVISSSDSLDHLERLRPDVVTRIGLDGLIFPLMIGVTEDNRRRQGDRLVGRLCYWFGGYHSRYQIERLTE